MTEIMKHEHIDKELILEYADDLIEYADSGLIDNVSDLSPLYTYSVAPIYRGLYLPKEWLCIGQRIEEWGGSSHWSKEEDVARRFSTSMDGEDFLLEYGEDRGFTEIADILSLFEPVILVIDEPVLSLDLDTCLDVLRQHGYDVNSIFLSNSNDEKEVSLFGNDFVIEKIENKTGCSKVKVKILNNQCN